jgi:hypothetical protein
LILLKIESHEEATQNDGEGQRYVPILISIEDLVDYQSKQQRPTTSIKKPTSYQGKSISVREDERRTNEDRSSGQAKGHDALQVHEEEQFNCESEGSVLFSMIADVKQSSFTPHICDPGRGG